MKEYLLLFRPFLLFLARFFASYLILAFLYQGYLSWFDPKNNEVDGITRMVAGQSEKVLSVFDGGSYTMPNPTAPNVKLFYHDTWVARIIEGCNGVSVMVLFVSFVVAFTGKFRHMLLFILGGILLIHVFNIARIALLCMAVFHYPQYKDVLHGVFFPLMIYGVVFVLWVVWVNKFSLYAKKSK